MRITVKAVKQKKIVVPVGKFASGDWFCCKGCGRKVQLLVRGNIATCSVCGGRMERI